MNKNVTGFTIENSDQVKFLPVNISEIFPNLLVFKVINCSVKSVKSEHFAKMQALKILNLNGNEIETVASDSFKDLGNLTTLVLSRNQIKSVNPKWFKSTSVLEVVYLDFNKIASIEENSFSHLKHLTRLHLEHNQIKLFSSKAFDHMVRLNRNSLYVELDGNICLNKTYREIVNLNRDLESNCTGLLTNDSTQSSLQCL